jgi:hypothetical protein
MPCPTLSKHSRKGVNIAGGDSRNLEPRQASFAFFGLNPERAAAAWSPEKIVHATPRGAGLPPLKMATLCLTGPFRI